MSHHRATSRSYPQYAASYELDPPAHADISDPKNTRMTDIPYPYVMTMFVHLASVPDRPMAHLWPIAQVAARWLGLKKFESVFQTPLLDKATSPTRVDVNTDDLSVSRVSLGDPRVQKLIDYSRGPLAAAHVCQRRPKAETPIWDYLIDGSLRSHHYQSSVSGSRFHTPCLELAVRIDPSTVGVPQIQGLAELLCEAAGEHLDIAHGCIEYGLMHSLGHGRPYTLDMGAWLPLDRAQQAYLWSKVADPARTVYRVGHATLLSPYFLERLSDDQPVDQWFQAFRLERVPPQFVTELPRGVRAFWVSNNPVEYMGDEIGRRDARSYRHSLTLSAELIGRLRSRGLMV